MGQAANTVIFLPLSDPHFIARPETGSRKPWAMDIGPHSMHGEVSGIVMLDHLQGPYSTPDTPYTGIQFIQGYVNVSDASYAYLAELGPKDVPNTQSQLTSMMYLNYPFVQDDEMLIYSNAKSHLTRASYLLV